MAKNTSHLLPQIPPLNRIEGVSVTFDENENIIIHVPERHMATLQTKDFKDYRVTVVPI